MKQPEKDSRIKVLRPVSGYEPGRVYVVIRVDPMDHTLMAVDRDGNEGGWVKWEDCTAAGDPISWAWLKERLSGEALELLSAFDGVEELRLKDEIRDRILIDLPNLKQRILDAQIELEEEQSHPLKGRMPPSEHQQAITFTP